MKLPAAIHAPIRHQAAAIRRRFWSHVRHDPGRCWIWKAYRDPKGYGQFSYRGRVVWAHRFAYALLNGVCRRGLTVHHRCGNPSCVNPNHLTQLPIAAHADRQHDETF